jgi:hypothetical protein
MPKFAVHARIVGSKYLGEFEADNADEAIAKAEASGASYVSMCHQCSEECEDPECDKITADLVEPQTEK